MITTRNRRTWGRLVGAAVVLASTLIGTASASAHPSGGVQARNHHQSARPTVVLVHGAWADSSSWSGVVRRLQHDHYPVRVFATPLRTLSGDTAALRDLLATISGPVVLVGHSYGGAVVSDAATGNAEIHALVYVDAFAPAAGETVAQLAGPDSVLANPDPTKVFSFVPATLPPTPATDLYILPGVFRRAFANDLPRRDADVLAVTQRPATVAALNQASAVPAWPTIRSWYEVGTIDKVIPASAQLAMAKRAGSIIVRRRTGHLPMISQPESVTRLIERAARATS